MIGSSAYEKVEPFKNVGSLLKNWNSIHKDIKFRLKAGNSYYSVQTLFSS